jgi:hypothetical protein
MFRAGRSSQDSIATAVKRSNAVCQIDYRGSVAVIGGADTTPLEIASVTWEEIAA